MDESIIYRTRHRPGNQEPTRRKEHVDDGIPGEAYKATRQWAIKPITEITNIITNGKQIPQRWTGGEIVYI